MVKVAILSCDGGGVRGLITLHFLLHLEQDLLKLTNKTIYETFDVFAGNSVGAIIIGSIVYLLGPSSKYKTISDLVNDMYTDDNFKKIFTKNRNPLTKLLLRPKYNGSYKTDILKRYLKDTIITDTEKKVLFPVYSISEQMPKFYKSYQFENNEESYDMLEPVLLARNVIDASSAAPSYFSPICYNVDSEEHEEVDGAICCNNPSDCIFADALRLFPDEDITILSIGTGSPNFKKLGKETRKWGLFQWAISGISDVILYSNGVTADYKTKHFANALGHKYLRVQEPVDIALDDISKIQELKIIAKDWYSKYKEQVLELFTTESSNLQKL